MIDDFDRVYLGLPTNGWLYKEEARLLWDAARKTSGTLVEFGSYHGRSLCLLAALGRRTVSVDPHDDPEHGDGEANLRAMVENLAERGITNVVVCRVRAEDWAPEPAGLVYCDGDHTYDGTWAQLEKAVACDPEAIAVHDVGEGESTAGIVRACVEFLGPWTVRVERLGVWERPRRVRV